MKLTTIAVPNPMISGLRGALATMEAAERAGLPIPTYATISAGAFGGPQLSLIPETLADLSEWADWLDVKVYVHGQALNGQDHHRVDATMFGLPISLCVIVDAAVSA